MKKIKEVETGTVIMGIGDHISGYLKCDGSPIKINTYKKLALILISFYEKNKEYDRINKKLGLVKLPDLNLSYSQDYSQDLLKSHIFIKHIFIKF